MLLPQRDPLLARLEAGDIEALAEIWARHYDQLLWLAEQKLDRMRLMRRVIDADDVLQQLFIQAVRDLPRYLAHRGQVHPYRWLSGLARGVIGDYFVAYLDTKTRCLRRQQAISDDGGEEVADGGPGPGEIAEASELAEIIEGLLSTLTPVEREAIEIAREEKRPIRRLMELHGLEADAAAQRICRARKELRKLMAQRLGDVA